MTFKLPQDETLLDLMVERATQGLSGAESVELERLLSQDPDVDRDAFDLAAAAIDVAFMNSSGGLEAGLPEDLRASILAGSDTHVGQRRQPTATKIETDVDNVRTIAAPPTSLPRPRRFIDTVGWYAAAAMLLLAVFVGVQRTTTVDEPPAASSVAGLRADLLADAPDVIQIAWAESSEPGYESVRGDVVWSNERQAGFMRLTGLRANSPELEQYQLWIVDPQRDEKPVDGGVFDIPTGADEVVIPIDAKLRIVAPAAFAITLEQPGGVVVSDGPLLVIAAAQA